MKYLLAVIGFLIGRILGEMTTGSEVIGYIVSATFGVVGFLIPAFFKYQKAKPKDLLAFHGPDSPITRTTSSGELRNFLSQLHKGGLLVDFNPSIKFAVVNEEQWNALGDSEKLTLCSVLAQAGRVDGNSLPEIVVTTGSMKTLANYFVGSRKIQYTS